MSFSLGIESYEKKEPDAFSKFFTAYLERLAHRQAPDSPVNLFLESVSMGIEKFAAKFFQMSDGVWARHANPWSVWTRYLCLPLLALAVWSRVWIGWMSVLLFGLVCLWIWFNPRVFGKPRFTHHWASRAVLGERVLLKHPKTEVPAHHQRAISALNFLTFSGFAMAIYGLVELNAAATVFGTIVTMLGKTWFLDRMVWLYQELAAENAEYSSWLY